MTAELAILNKKGVALAADSAVTSKIASNSGSKIFMAANKIFMLSKYDPVAIMIYNNASFMGVPWETIIKIYRKQLDPDKFNKLEEYADHFLEYIEKQDVLNNIKEQSNFVHDIVYVQYNWLYLNVRSSVDRLLKRYGKISKIHIRKILNHVITDETDVWLNAQPLVPNYAKYKTVFLTTYQNEIDECITGWFSDFFLTKKLKNMLKEIAVSLCSKYHENYFSHNFSGIVITGFGTTDIFPRLIEYKVEGIANNVLKSFQVRKSEIGENLNSQIIPFAQSEKVYSFICGIEPNYRSKVNSEIKSLILNLPKLLLEHIDELGDKDKTDYLKLFEDNISQDKIANFIKNLADYETENYIEPVINIIKLLPLSEMAAMAESLVNLTSLRRRFSEDEETVGGPIDVAVISRGDGFIWMKRKHYFDAKLNPHYFQNYAREESDEEKK